MAVTTAGGLENFNPGPHTGRIGSTVNAKIDAGVGWLGLGGGVGAKRREGEAITKSQDLVWTESFSPLDTRGLQKGIYG
jgi:hypothetical protein